MNKKLMLAAALGIIALAAGIFLFTRDETPAPSKTPKVGLVVPMDVAALFLETQLTELGYIEGENIQYLTVTVNDPQEYAAAVQTLIDSDVDVIVCTNAPVAVVASELTKTIPIVFTSNQDQFSTDIEPILSQQGVNTNLTGVITTNPAEKRFELLMEMKPSIKVVYVPYDPNDPHSVETLGLLESAAASYGVTLETYEFSDDAGAQRALDEMPEGVDAILIGEEIPSMTRMSPWAELSIERKVPLVVPLGQFSEGLLLPKVLMGYGGGIQDLYQNGAALVDQILKGTAPADLPPLPYDVYLTVSLGAAEALGIQIPDSVLDQASQIVRTELVQETTGNGTAAGAACNATLKTPIGENSVCMTISCDRVRDGGFETYFDKVTVESCSTENLIGKCSTASGSTYFYSGNVAPIASGCVSNGGEWKTSAE